MIIVSRDVFLTSANSTDFCVLILYPANMFICCKNVLVVSLKSLVYRILPPAERNGVPSFPHLLSFVPFSAIIVIAKTSGAILNKSRLECAFMSSSWSY